MLLWLTYSVWDSKRPGFAIWTLSILGALAVLGIVAWELTAWEDRRHARRVVAHGLPGSEEEIAARCLLKPLAENRRRLWFDASEWFERLGSDRAPRVVVVGPPPAPVPIPDDVYEEIDLYSTRAVKRSAKIRVAGAMAMYAAWFVLMVIIPGRPGRPWWSIGSQPMSLFFGCMAVWFCVRVGWVPFHLRSAIVSPGRLACAGLFMRPAAYTRRDSVLVVTMIDSISAAKLCREDGRTVSFYFASGMDDPGLAQLVSRWCAPASPEFRGVIRAAEEDQAGALGAPQ